MSVRVRLAGALGVLLIGFGPQALAQFQREGPRVPDSGAPAAVPASVPVAAPVPADKPPPPAVTPDTLLLDGRPPGGVLGPGSEGVGALIRPPEPAPGPLAAASTTPGAEAPGAAGAAADGAKPAAHHARAHKRRPHRPLRQPES